MLGVIAPLAVAVFRVFTLAIANTPFFGQGPTSPNDPSGDPMLVITACIMTASVVVLGAMVAFEYAHRRRAVTAVVLLVPAIVIAAFNWYLVLS